MSPPRLRSPNNIREVGRLAADEIEKAAKSCTRAKIFSNVGDSGRRFALIRAAAEHAIAAGHLARAVAHLQELL